MTKKIAASQTSLQISMGKIPFWLRQKALISRTAETMRPGGYMLTHRAVDVCGFSPGDAILDAGCGYGMTLSYLTLRQRCRVTGLDCDGIALEKVGSRTSSQPPLIQGSLPDLPLATNSFKGVFCECVLSLLPDPKAALDEFTRVLAPNGYLVLADLYLKKWLPAYERLAHPETCAQGAAPLVQMMRWIQGAGLKIHIIEDHSSLLSQLGQAMGQGHTRGGPPGYAMIIAQKV